MAEHPRFAAAWTQKLCQFANASACHEDDPELQRVAGAFRDSNHDFKTLVRELFSSPLVTYAEPTKTAETNGVVISIARRETLCARLGNRLGIARRLQPAGRAARCARAAAARPATCRWASPASAYARADEKPVMPARPEPVLLLGHREAVHAAGRPAGRARTTGRWKVAGPRRRPRRLRPRGDGRAAQRRRASPALRAILDRTTTRAVAAKETPAEALRSTFMLACSSPLAVSSGL